MANAARKALDFLGGTKRYNSADEPTSAPAMAARKQKSQTPEKGPVRAAPESNGAAAGVVRQAKQKVEKKPAGNLEEKPMLQKKAPAKAARY